MSMNLYLILPRSRATDDNGTRFKGIPVQINTNNSYRIIFENYHWVENKGNNHQFLRRSSFKRSLNKYKEYMMQRAHLMYPREEWPYTPNYRRWHNEECVWVLKHIAEISILGEQGAIFEAG